MIPSKWLHGAMLIAMSISFIVSGFALVKMINSDGIARILLMMLCGTWIFVGVQWLKLYRE